MAPHQTRVIAERQELDTRLCALVLFITGPVFETLGFDERSRLNRQTRAMCDYREVLDERIAAFNETTAVEGASHV